MFYLYKITNLINNKIYIGQTESPDTRWKNHLRYAENPDKTKQYIHYAMKKYGAQNFTFEVIAMSKNREDTNHAESILIIQYKSLDKNFGYNLTVGGDYGGHSERTKEKLRQATLNQINEKGHPALGIKHSEESIEKQKATRKLNPKPYCTDDAKIKISNTLKGRKQSAEIIEKRKIGIQKTLDAKINKQIENGELKCHAPGCEVTGRNDYTTYESKKYCKLHGRRMKRNGHINKMPNVGMTGKAPPNKKIFTEEQINLIVNDPRSTYRLAKDFKITEKVIARVRRENSKV
jgi:group I intron endonuclease